MKYIPTVMNIDMPVVLKNYKTVHLAEHNNIYSSIACRTPHANVCSSNHADVNCRRCMCTNKYKYAADCKVR